MTFSFVPGTFNVPPSPNHAEILISGSYILSSAGVPQAVSETLSADFNVEGYTVTGLSALGIAEDDGVHVSENIEINSPCSTFIAGDSTGSAGCFLPSGVHSGSLVVRLEIHSDICSPGHCDSGVVGGANIQLSVQPIPEPSVLLLASLGIMALGFSRNRQTQTR